MEDGFNQVGIPIFHSNETRIEKTRCGSSDMACSNNTQVPFKVTRRKRVMTAARRRSGIRRKRREILKVRSEKSGGGDDDEDEDEDEDVERKVVALQRIVPGGEALGVDKLFDETADYILGLQCKIKAMRVLANLLEGLEKEKRKFGGWN